MCLKCVVYHGKMFGLTCEDKFVCIMASIQFDNKGLFVNDICELCIWVNDYLRY